MTNGSAPIDQPDEEVAEARKQEESKAAALESALRVDQAEARSEQDALEEKTREAAEALLAGTEEVDPEEVEQAKAEAAAAALLASNDRTTSAVVDVTSPVEEEDDEEFEPREIDMGLVAPDDGIERKWFALHAYSGQEGNVKRNLQARAEQLELTHHFGGILVPMEEVAEVKAGEKKVSKRKYFPGYVLVRLPEHPETIADLWHLIKDTPGVSGFIGGTRNRPTPLADNEVNAIIEEVRGERKRPKPKVAFDEGERVKIIDGPFANFMGNISEIDTERDRLKVMVEIFERLTSIEVEFWQVEQV